MFTTTTGRSFVLTVVLVLIAVAISIYMDHRQKDKNWHHKNIDRICDWLKIGCVWFAIASMIVFTISFLGIG